MGPPRISHPLLLISALSGAAALAFELIWARQLVFVFGASQYAVTTVLAAFMLGLGLGSHVGGFLADRGGNPFRRLAAVLAALALLGPLLSAALFFLPSIAASTVPSLPITHPSALAIRFASAVIVMLPGTLLMGAVFPIMTRSAAADAPGLHASLGWLYASNTLGGLFGVLGTIFFILPRHGVAAVVACAALAAAASSLLAARSISRNDSYRRQTAIEPPERTRLSLMAISACSGAAVIGGETLWNRCLGIVFANSTYTFALLLAIYLTGLGIGGILASRIQSRGSRPLRSWARLQAAAALWVASSLLLLPSIALIVRQLRPDLGWSRVLFAPLVVGGVLIIPMTLILGAAWPLLLARATPRIENGGRAVGDLCMSNAVGAAIGTAAAGWLVLPAFGFGRSFLLLAALHAALAAFGFFIDHGQRALRVSAAASAALVVSAVLAPRFGQVPLPSSTLMPHEPVKVSYRESATGTVTVLEDPETGGRSMYVDNNAVIGTTFDALKVVRMLGLVPALLHPAPSRVLVIGYGAGVTTAVLNAIPAVDHIDVREIIPAVVAESHRFESVNHNVLDSPKVQLGYGDGRNYLLLSDDLWDVITCDPVHPLYGSASLYSAEFFSLARRHLRPGGLMCQYLPLHHMPPDAFRRAIYTFQQEFPHVRVAFSLGHAVLIGSTVPLDLDWERWSRRLASFEHPQDLVDSVLHTPAQIAALFQLDSTGCREIALAPASTDTMPYLEFLEPAAYDPGNWQENAKALIERYTSPLPEIRGLPPEVVGDFRRLVAGKRLLLFSQLELANGNPSEAREWLDKALMVAPEDPEIIRFATRPAPRRPES